MTPRKEHHEIDVIGRTTDVIGLLYVYAVIECKKSSKPWIVFTSDKAGYNRIWSFAIMTNNASQAVNNHLDRMLEIDWFNKNGRLGYGITEAFTSKEDETFKAGMTATKASISLVKNETNSLRSEFLSFFFPTVVLDGRLFEFYLEQNGNPVVAEINSAFLLFPIRIGENSGSTVRIVTIKAFDRYCTEISSVYHSLKNVLSAEMEELAKSIGMHFK